MLIRTVFVPRSLSYDCNWDANPLVKNPRATSTSSETTYDIRAFSPISVGVAYLQHQSFGLS